MTSISSLSLWSSIKISFPRVSSCRNEETIIPYVDPLSEDVAVRDQVESKKSCTEMVNLRVPTDRSTARGKEKENSVPTVCACSNMHRRKTSQILRKRPKDVSVLAVPETPSTHDDHQKGDVEKSVKNFDRKNENSSEITFANVGDFRHERDFSFTVNWEKTNFEFDYEDDDGENDWIPSVRPWTLKELEKINRTYERMERRIKKITEKKLIKQERADLKMKSKTRGLKPLNDESGMRSRKILADHDSNEHLYDSRCPTTNSDLKASACEETKLQLKSENPGYYESKLAKLRMIELGLEVYKNKRHH